MESLISVLSNPATLSMMIPIIAIICSFGFAGLKAHYRHQERIEKIRHGVDPDQK